MSVIGRRSSGVEHFHGKEGVSGSNPDDGSISKSISRLSPIWVAFSFVQSRRLCIFIDETIGNTGSNLLK